MKKLGDIMKTYQEVLQMPATFFNVKQVENKFGVSNQTAMNDLHGLVAEGLFEERKFGKKRKISG
ncbi:hypothetical protein EGT74_03355 [Chitinophaga lutea]|uniref:DeoR family transcriptional regulator n=1 Tax=Chitinophaga lutea TaxID=2488634 RepID=A0A3N4Q526_9BACT|nr:hypothetical protein [Chitinophaga lutea]RPE12601.1 hypothetical protein EGT74_03355 [Chitinophaga lutea]